MTKTQQNILNLWFLIEENHREYLSGKNYVFSGEIHFGNGYSVAVLKTEKSPGSDKGLYEMKIKGGHQIPIGWLTPFEVYEKLVKISQKEKKHLETRKQRRALDKVFDAVLKGEKHA